MYFTKRGMNGKDLKNCLPVSREITSPGCIPYKLRKRSSTWIFAFSKYNTLTYGVNLADFLRHDHFRVERKF